jgi:hypothetical protein
MSYTYREHDQKLASWKIGAYYEEFLYDTRGRLIEIQRFNDLASIKYSYGHGEQVSVNMKTHRLVDRRVQVSSNKRFVCVSTACTSTRHKQKIFAV